MLKTLVYVGLVLAAAGFVCSISPSLDLNVVGSLLTLAAILCAAVISLTTLNVPVDKAASARSRIPMTLLGVLVIIVAAASFWMQSHGNPNGRYFLAAAMAGIAVVLLLQPRSQGKLL